MTKNPVFCLANDCTAKAAQLMMEHDTGTIPVVTNREDVPSGRGANGLGPCIDGRCRRLRPGPDERRVRDVPARDCVLA
jgi:hypothetical protein